MITNLCSAELDFVNRVRDFVNEEVLPKTREWEANRAFDPAIWKKLGHLGLLSMTLPQEKGGQGLTCRAFCEAVRELAKGDPALSMNVAAINALVIAHLDRFSTPAQADKYLQDAISGELKLAWGLTEPDAGSDARRVKTRATAIDDRPEWYRLNGQKMFITNGGNADLIVIMAKVSDHALGAFLMETSQAGFNLERRINTVGVSASNTVQFRLTDAEAWITPCKFDDALGLLYRGRLAIAAMALGIAEKAQELAIDYSKQREQFNRRLADMQSVQNMLADSAVEIEASRLLIARGATLYDEGQPIVKESSFAKLYASETSNRVTNRAIQIHGGRGMTPDFLVEKLWRDAKLTEIGEGCSEIQRLVIAKQVLK
jgi:alkylation response protein AidB-like acyl-CoA dehydrogenase